MPLTRVPVGQFLDLAVSHPVIDVRSPGEYAHAHIPGAFTLPLFDDRERKEIGTIYKQRSRQDAIKTGLDFFGPKMRGMVTHVEKLLQKKACNNKKTILVHCWRGGMRSGAIGWLMDLYGFNVCLLEGGYKAYRNWVLDQFRKNYPFKLIGGYTGSGKTLVLKEMERLGYATLDLEGIAQHKGSAFGGLDNQLQPANEMFENLIADRLYRLTAQDPQAAIWVEDESQRIGDLNMPIELWHCFRTKPLYFLDIPFEQRADHIVQEYGNYSKERLINAIVRIQKRLGGLETRTAINYLLEDNLRNCFTILLKYYDKHYGKALDNRPNLPAVMRVISTKEVNAMQNCQKILQSDAQY